MTSCSVTIDAPALSPHNITLFLLGSVEFQRPPIGGGGAEAVSGGQIDRMVACAKEANELVAAKAIDVRLDPQQCGALVLRRRLDCEKRDDPHESVCYGARWRSGCC